MRSTYNRTIQDYIIYYIQNNLLNHWTWIKNAWLDPSTAIGTFFLLPAFLAPRVSLQFRTRIADVFASAREDIVETRIQFHPDSGLNETSFRFRWTPIPTGHAFSRIEKLNCIRARACTNRGREKARGGFDDRSQDFIFIGEQTIEIENLRDQGTRWYILLVRSHSIVERRRTKVCARRIRETPRSKDLGERSFLDDGFALSILFQFRDCRKAISSSSEL